MGVIMADTGQLVPRPLVRLPGQWQFWADQIVGSTALGVVDVSSFKCTSKLSDFGTGEVVVDLPCGLDESRLRRLWSWRIWSFYNGVPIWCGVPTGIVDSGSAQATVTLTELPGYLTKRVWDVFPSQVLTQIEQTTIAAQIAAPLADVGCSVVTSPGPGVLRDRTYEYLESGARAALLTNLAQVLQGPQFRAEYALAGGLPHCTLKIGYPRVGSGASGLGLTVPGGALAYQAQWDADAMRTRTFAVGDVPQNAAAGTARPVRVVDQPQPDLPRLDAVDDWPGVVVTSTLTERASAAATQQSAPALHLTASPSESWPSLELYGVGDDVTISATTPLLPGGLTVTGTLTQIDIDAGAGTAAWTVAVTLPPPRAREALTARLARLDLKVAGTFRGGPKTILP